MTRLAALTLFTTAVALAADPPAAQVDKLFARFDRRDSPGCALAVMRAGEIVYKRGYGMANLDHDAPITPSTVFHVASVSKQFTAAAVALLAQEGKLSLDDEVRQHIPELPDFGPRIAIRHLVHHTSGLRDQWGLLELAGWRYSLDLITDEDVLEMMSRQKDLNFPPGDRQSYSNSGYTLMGLIVKRVSGQSLREFTTKRIFEPLGMKNTHFRDDHAEIVKGQAYGYVPSKETFRLSVTNFDTVGATSLLTTVEDLALWDRNFYEPRVGGPKLIEQMHQRGRLANGEQQSYAFGLTHGRHKGLPVVQHSGGDAGYRAHLMRFPEQRFSVACLCNAGSANPSRLARDVADLYLEPKDTEPAAAPTEPTVAVDAALLASYAGAYWRRDGDQIRKFAFQDGKLRLLLGGDQRGPLRALAVDRFRAEGPPFDEFRFEAGRLLESLDGGPAKPDVYERAAEFSPSDAALREYAGVYHSEEVEMLFRLAVENGKLTLKRLKTRPAILEPAVPDVFTGPPGSLRFVRDPRGAITGAVLNSGRMRNFRLQKR